MAPLFTGLARNLGGYGFGRISVVGASSYVFGDTNFYTLSGSYLEYGYVTSILQDSSDVTGKTIYVVAIQNDANAKSFVSKIDLGTPQILWQKTFGNTATYGKATSCAVDSGGNVIVASSCATGNLLFKYNSSGTLQWQRNLQASSVYYGAWNDLSVDSSDNIYVAGNASGGGGGDCVLAKYNSSGSLQWQRRMGMGDSSGWAGVRLDSSANVYVSGSVKNGPYYRVNAKYNSSGTIQYQVTTNTSGAYWGKIAIDSSTGDHWITAYDSGALAKYNSSGSLQWSVNPGSTHYNIAYANSTLYLGGINSQYYSSRNPANGSINWQKSISNVGISDIEATSTYIYFTGVVTSGGDIGKIFIGVVNSTTGGTNGTYGSYTLSNSTLSNSALVLTSSVSAYTTTASSYTDAAGPQSEATPAVTIANV